MIAKKHQALAVAKAPTCETSNWHFHEKKGANPHKCRQIEQEPIILAASHSLQYVLTENAALVSCNQKTI